MALLSGLSSRTTPSKQPSGLSLQGSKWGTFSNIPRQKSPLGAEEIHKCCAISDTAAFESSTLCSHILTTSMWVRASILFWGSLCSFFEGRHFLIKLSQVFYWQQKLLRTNNLITQDSYRTLTDTFHLGICLCLEFSMMKKLHGLDLRVFLHRITFLK